MAIKDKNKKQFIQDRDENVFIGIDLPFRLSIGPEGYFASTETTLLAIKNNIRSLLKTEKGERFFQPNLGINLRRYLFEQLTPDTELDIEAEIIDQMKQWLPFVQIQKINVKKS